MNPQWEKRRLGEVCEINPEKIERDYPHNDILYIDISSVGTGYLNEEPRLMSRQEAPSRAQRLVRDGDTIVSTVRPNRRSFLFLRCPEPNTVVSTGFAVLRARKKLLDERFLCYLVTNPTFTDYLVANTDGSAYPAVNPKAFERAEIELPPYGDQKYIAEILGVLDDKINLNRQMNKTLEAIVQAIFKSWFVDFDPVTAKIADRKPFGMDESTAKLFPNEFSDSALGAIPNGWRVSRIGDEVHVVGGSTPNTGENHFWENGEINWITPKDLSLSTDSIVFSTQRKITQQGLEQISSGLLPIGTVLLSSRAPIGYLALTDIPLAINQGFIAMICDKLISNLYAFYWTRQNMDEILSRAGGTTFAEISKQNFRPIAVILPDSKVMLAFNERVTLHFQKLSNNLRETSNLFHLRNLLLPKLLSGEVRVKQAEKIVEKVS